MGRLERECYEVGVPSDQVGHRVQEAKVWGLKWKQKGTDPSDRVGRCEQEFGVARLEQPVQQVHPSDQVRRRETGVWVECLERSVLKEYLSDPVGRCVQVLEVRWEQPGRKLELGEMEPSAYSSDPVRRFLLRLSLSTLLSASLTRPSDLVGLVLECLDQLLQRAQQTSSSSGASSLKRAPSLLRRCRLLTLRPPLTSVCFWLWVRWTLMASPSLLCSVAPPQVFHFFRRGEGAVGS